jgi:hypothetical protein
MYSAHSILLDFIILNEEYSPVKKTGITAVGIHRADHPTPLYPQKLALTSPTN